MENICRTVARFSVKTSHPQFHNQLFSGVCPLGVAASWMVDVLNTSSYTYEVAPVFTLMEDACLKYVLNSIGWPEGEGIFAPGGSISNMYSLICARFKIDPDLKKKGLYGLEKPLVVFTSGDSHYSLMKSAHWIGIGTDNLIKIKTDDKGKMLTNELNQAIQQAFVDGKRPFMVNATCGTTVLGAFDDLEEISHICKRYDLWLHVDACLGGTVLFSEKYRHLVNGIEKADSVTYNPHKTFGIPLQCSLFLIREKGFLDACNSSHADYLFQQDKFYDVSYDTGDKSIQCGRKVDAFKFWLAVKAHGASEISHLIDHAFACAHYLAGKIRLNDGFRLVLDRVEYTNVCFWYIPRKFRNQEETEEWWDNIYETVLVVKERMTKQGTIMIGYAPLPGKNIGNFFRMVVTCHSQPTKESMDFILTEIERLAEEED